MPAKKTSSAPPEAVAAYDKLIASNPNIERKGATMPYTAVNGNMFSLLTPSGEYARSLKPKATKKK